MRLIGSFFIVALALLLSTAVMMAQEDSHKHHHAGAPPEKLGNVDFPISCGEAVQKEFNRAVALLHSFWYDEAYKAFRAIAKKDAKCAMASWGIAMSLYHPLWTPPSEAELEEGRNAVQRAKSVGAPTERERDYIGAIETFYKDSEKLDHRTRALAYEKAMERLYLRYPDDIEAAVFYALALNGTALPEDKTYENQRKGGTILEKIFIQQPEHPGVAHYIVHSYDYPPLAEKGLDAARRYAKIAPSSPHALHMPSHIFTRLGLWQESIESNLASAAAARDHIEKNDPGASSFDDLHAMDYLMYAYLQGAEDKKAKELLDRLQRVKRFDQENFAAAYALIAIPARYALEHRRWSDAARLELHPPGFAWKTFPYAEALVYYGRGLGAARTDDITSARTDLERMVRIKNALQEKKQGYWSEQVRILELTVSAWIALAEGKKDDALGLMRSAADLEASTEKHPVTPGPVLPAEELLADMLLTLNRPAEALAEYEASLRTSPERFNGLYGAARAAELAGNRQRANDYYTRLLTLCSNADSERQELSRAMAYVKGK